MRVAGLLPAGFLCITVPALQGVSNFLQSSAIQCNPVLCSAIQCNPVQTFAHCTLECNTQQCPHCREAPTSSMHRILIQSSAIQGNPMQCTKIQSGASALYTESLPRLQCSPILFAVQCSFKRRSYIALSLQLLYCRRVQSQTKSNTQSALIL